MKNDIINNDLQLLIVVAISDDITEINESKKNRYEFELDSKGTPLMFGKLPTINLIYIKSTVAHLLLLLLLLLFLNEQLEKMCCE